MSYLRVLCAAPLLGSLLWISAAPVMAQVEEESVPLIMMKPQGASFSTSNLRKLYAALKKRAGKATSQILPLTKTEVWTVPKAKVDDVRRTAARHGVIMSALSATWNHVFHKAPPGTKMSDQQQSMVDKAKASKATMGVDIMTAPAAPMVEYALIKDAGTSDARNAPSITVAVNDDTVLTIRRTSVDIRSDMCVWRGVVETTGAPATLMWWPGGRMTGTVEDQGRIYSIRHMGGQMQAIVEMGEDKMPPEHAAAVPFAQAVAKMLSVGGVLKKAKCFSYYVRGSNAQDLSRLAMGLVCSSQLRVGSRQPLVSPHEIRGAQNSFAKRRERPRVLLEHIECHAQ